MDKLIRSRITIFNHGDDEDDKEFEDEEEDAILVPSVPMAGESDEDDIDEEEYSLEYEDPPLKTSQGLPITKTT
jgi:hypothetical protein